MKILIYSDIHISRTSSILPNTYNQDSKYSYRQQMIIKTGEFLADIADEYKPDLIINLGDTFDQHTVTSYDIDTASEFFKCFRNFNIPHLVLVGNHEMINSNFNAIQLLSNITNITVISKPSSVSVNNLMAMYSKHTQDDLKPDTRLAFLPYCDYTNVLTFPEGDFLFSHMDIQGASIRGNVVMEEGIDADKLQQTYRLVFNGHIHKPSLYKNVLNVGSTTTHSFADDNDTVPQCYIFDTDTLDLQTFKPKVCPLFRKIDVQSMQELEEKILSFDDSYKYIITCSCPFDIKDSVKEYIQSNDKIINHRLNVKVNKDEVTEDREDIILQQSNLDIIKSFKEFLNTVELKYPIDKYYSVLDKMEEVDENEL